MEILLKIVIAALGLTLRLLVTDATSTTYYVNTYPNCEHIVSNSTEPTQFYDLDEVASIENGEIKFNAIVVGSSDVDIAFTTSNSLNGGQSAYVITLGIATENDCNYYKYVNLLNHYGAGPTGQDGTSTYCNRPANISITIESSGDVTTVLNDQAPTTRNVGQFDVKYLTVFSPQKTTLHYNCQDES